MNDPLREEKEQHVTKAETFEEQAATWEKRAHDANAAARSSHDLAIAAEYERLAERYASLCETSRKMAAFYHERARLTDD